MAEFPFELYSLAENFEFFPETASNCVELLLLLPSPFESFISMTSVDDCREFSGPFVKFSFGRGVGSKDWSIY